MHSNKYFLDGGVYMYTNEQYNQELKHYGVIGMKWGVRRAKKKGTNYSYKSIDTKYYEQRASKARAKGNEKRATKFETKAKYSAKLDKGMEQYARKLSTGKTVAASLLNSPWHLKAYATAKAAGADSFSAAAASMVSSYIAAPFGSDLIRSYYVHSNTARDLKSRR
jgi:hypothetical protein